jgi:3-phenylpropionate/trans-cinnamate dioxygenase ferredoxin reductase component
VNVWDVNEHVQNLIRSRNKVDPGALTDPDTPLETLTSSGQNG